VTGRGVVRLLNRELPRLVRRVVVAIVLLGYPLLVAAWVGLPMVGVPPLVWALTVGVLALAVIGGAGALYAYRHAMAQAPDSQLDERQIAVRDRAYLSAYRVFVALVLVALLLAGVVPDILDRPLEMTFETVQPLFWGAMLYSIILPSAIVAWQEPDLREAA
jgi:hypothetical protein